MGPTTWARIWYATGVLLFVIGVFFVPLVPTSPILYLACDGGALIAMLIAYYYMRKADKR